MPLSAMFDRGAAHYDLLVGLNPGYHAELRRAADALAERVVPTPGHGVHLIDLACGSGISTRALLDALPAATMLGLDASGGMLAHARAKQWPPSVRFEEATAGELDVDDLGRGCWDGILTAYLFRNVPTECRDAALAETFDLLAPGGWLVVQEYSVDGRAEARARWHAVCWLAIIPLGILLDRNFGLYRYLWRSVLDFDSLQRFGDRLAAAGFVDIARHHASGWQQGILHTFVARKPG
jgi:ubiquinone/menaquinone biosynthesis C-methylase UbiE